jgi:hypothetical protein
VVVAIDLEVLVEHRVDQRESTFRVGADGPPVVARRRRTRERFDPSQRFDDQGDLGIEGERHGGTLSLHPSM